MGFYFFFFLVLAISKVNRLDGPLDFSGMQTSIKITNQSACHERKSITCKGKAYKAGEL